MMNPSHSVVLATVVLWSAAVNLEWTQVGQAVWLVPAACGMLGLAQLFGGLLLCSPCTRAVGLAWSSVAFGSAVVLAAASGAWLSALAAATLAVAGAVGARVVYERSRGVRTLRPSRPDRACIPPVSFG